MNDGVSLNGSRAAILWWVTPTFKSADRLLIKRRNGGQADTVSNLADISKIWHGNCYSTASFF